MTNRSHGRRVVTVRRLVLLAVASALAAAAVAAAAYGRPHHRRPPLPVPTPIGVGPRFALAPGPPRAVAGLGCSSGRDRRLSVHVELFAGGRALLLPAGIGVRPPRRIAAGNVVAGRCEYPLATLDPTGTVRVSAARSLRLEDLFRVWGQPLGAHRLCGFHSPAAVRVYLNGRRWPGPVGALPLRRHDEIVVEVGSYVRPHARYVFPEDR
ncbi:MAG TPA: hypothetical protein VFQ71_13185 [Gaiellales bacterium]|nr:hypothetical protein [Gaiellales bacterium]